MGYRYKALFEIYGETEELVEEYVSEIIRGGVAFEEYNSEKVTTRYLEERYGAGCFPGEGRWVLDYKSEIFALDWMTNLYAPECNYLYLSENGIRSIIGLGKKIAPIFPNLFFFDVTCNPFPEDEWEIELPNLQFICDVVVPCRIYEKYKYQYPNLFNLNLLP